MASSRTLGKGRVIGTAKPPVPDRIRNNGVLSPSESSISLNSQGSTSKSSVEENDIATVVASQVAENAEAASAASSRLVCPICNEEMMTLLQLNRHLDDAHKHLQDVEQDEVKTWFKTQMVKAKKFQPLAVLNQKLKGLDVFESNDNERQGLQPSRPQQGGITSARSTPEPTLQDPDELVTREHWQRYTPTNSCSDPMCGKHLSGTNGRINCRKCGKLFCEEHTMYQMKLSRSAQHEPVRGYWCRVCETCYISREGYNDHNGVERDHMKDFASIRRKAVDKSYLDVSRLEKRLTKLTQLLAEPSVQQSQGVVGYLWSFSGNKPQQRVVEESVVDWEDDASVLQCPFCHQEFSTYSFRRHHCRLCGRVVCADPVTLCSTEVGLDVSAPTVQLSEKDGDKVSVDVRMCRDCKRTIFSKQDFNREISADRPDQRAFQNLKQFERGISTLLPKFQKLLTALQDPDNPPSQSHLAEATKVRKRLTDTFTQYALASQRIRDQPTTSPTQRKLQSQIHTQASHFLHQHMLPLKALPKMLQPRSASPAPNGHPSRQPHHHRSPLAAAAADADTEDGSSEGDKASVLSTLETSERALHDRLIVLEEQRVLVGEMAADARRRRKVDEAQSLGRNLRDLEEEADGVRKELEGVRRGVEGVYLGESTGK